MSLEKTLRILLVEDVAEARELLKSQLESRGCVVDTAQNLWEARLCLDRRRPDVMLLDEIMPGESVLDFISDTLGQDATYKIVIVTGVESPNPELPNGVLGRFSKPELKGESFDRFFKKLLQACHEGHAIK